MRVVYLVFCLFAGLCACNRSSGEDPLAFGIPEFPESVEAKPVAFEQDLMMGYIGCMGICGPYFMLVSQSDNYVIHLLDKNDGRFVRYFLSLGRRRDEVLNPSVLLYPEKDRLRVMTMDIGGSRVLSYQLSDSLAFDYDTTVVLKKQYGGMVCLPSGDILTSRYLEVDRYDENGRSIRQQKIVPELRETEDLSDIEYFYMGASSQNGLTLKPDGTKMIRHSTNILSMVEYFDCTGDSLVKYKELRLAAPLFEKRPGWYNPTATKQCVKGIIDITADGRYVYVLFNSAPYSIPVTYDRQLWCFDWEGNPVKEYRIPARVYRMALDEETNRMYVAWNDWETKEEFLGYIEL